MSALKDQKRDYLKRSVQFLKEQKSLTQRDIAKRMEEDEGSLSSKLSGSRGITDDYIDEFAKVFDLPFNTGGGPNRDALIERILKAQEEQATLLKTLAELILARGKA